MPSQVLAQVRCGKIGWAAVGEVEQAAAGEVEQAAASANGTTPAVVGAVGAGRSWGLGSR